MKQSKTQLMIFATLIASMLFSSVYAQEIQLSKEDSLGNVLNDVKSDVDALKKLKITGYIQAQWQLADTAGAASFAGGNFPATSDNRFVLRRGRIKFLYGNDYNQFVMQFDVTQGGFATKDIYLKLTDPFINAFSLTGGVFNRPFGYEIAFSSKDRESPERARFMQTLFPGERDLGAQISFNPPKTSKFNFFHLDAGLFTGNGINPEFDSKKDIIGHLWISKSTTSEKIKYGLGFSYYNGFVFQGNKYVYKMSDLGGNVKGFMVDSTTTNKNSFTARQYIGVDGQFSIETPAGISTLRGEYVTGTQPGSPTTTNSPTNTLPNYDTYIRKFNAVYVYFVQSIFQTKHKIVVKYDYYDPNTEVSGTDLNATNNGIKTKLAAPDIKYSTIGLGYIYHFDNNLKFTVYYDMVTNESTQIAKYTGDLKDNVWTIRIQYKF